MALVVTLVSAVAVVTPDAIAGRYGGKTASQPYHKHRQSRSSTTVSMTSAAPSTSPSATSPSATAVSTTAVATTAVATTKASTAAARPVSTEDELGRFRVECDFSHRAQVDPIVNPGPPGTPSAHMHDFFGNVSTGAESTYSSMLGKDTTCGFSGDTAGYWVPSLMNEDHEYIEPERMLIYYRNRPISYGSTTVFPKDFRMVAGGESAYPHAYWTCDGQSDGALESRSDEPPDCGRKDVKMQVFFPSCWDGVRIDSPNHRDHVAYAYDEEDGTSTDIGDDTCPASHPVKIPQLHLRVLYPAQDGASYHMSDMAMLAHADFWNTWDQDALETAVKDCVAAGENCEELED